MLVQVVNWRGWKSTSCSVFCGKQFDEDLEHFDEAINSGQWNRLKWTLNSIAIVQSDEARQRYSVLPPQYPQME